MKFKILTLVLIFLYCSCVGQDIVTINGNFPVIISAPHGGKYQEPNVLNRTSGVTTTDSYTIELATEIHKELGYILNKKPYLVYANRSRKEIDLNRELKDSFRDPSIERIWYQYHHEIQSDLIKNMWSDSVIIYLDIHGQNHAHQMLEIGFDTRDFNSNHYLLGDMYIKNGILSYPAKNINEPSPYFDGGYCIETYKHYPNVFAIQLEVPYKYRKTNKNRKDFAKKTAKIIADYYAVLQKEKK